jgi:hypothetical protein
MAAAISAADRILSFVIQSSMGYEGPTMVRPSTQMEMVKRLDRKRKHILTPLQRSARLAYRTVTSSGVWSFTVPHAGTAPASKQLAERRVVEKPQNERRAIRLGPTYRCAQEIS